MNLLNLLTMPREPTDVEIRVGVWIDGQPLLRPAAAFLAHHRTLHAAASVAAGIALAPVVAAANAVATAGRVIDQAHAAAGEGTTPCRSCLTAEARQFARDGTLTYTDVCNAWDLTDGGLA